MIGICEIINRLRHNRGYGVQSPAAFFFVMHVLRETLPYYAYTQINQTAKKEKKHSAAHCRRLFRIANHTKARNIILLTQDEATAKAISTANSNTPCYLPESHKSHIEIPNKIVEKDIDAILKKVEEIGLLYIGDPDSMQEILQKSLPHTNKHSVIIVEGIRKNRNIKEIWKKAIAQTQVVISIDMYSCGILLFNPTFRKQHYTFLFK